MAGSQAYFGLITRSSVHARRPDRRRHDNQLPPLGVTGYFYIQIYGLNGTPGLAFIYPTSSLVSTIPPHSYGEHSFWYNAIGHLNLMMTSSPSWSCRSSDYVGGASTARSVEEHPRAAGAVGIGVTGFSTPPLILSDVRQLGARHLGQATCTRSPEPRRAAAIRLAALIAGGCAGAPSRSRSCSLLRRALPDPGLWLQARCWYGRSLCRLLIVVSGDQQVGSPAAVDRPTSTVAPASREPRAVWSLVRSFDPGRPGRRARARASERDADRLVRLRCVAGLLAGECPPAGTGACAGRARRAGERAARRAGVGVSSSLPERPPSRSASGGVSFAGVGNQAGCRYNRAAMFEIGTASARHGA